MWQLLRKELLHILRDRGLVIFILYAFTLDIHLAAQGFKLIPEMVSISVYDEDRSSRSRALVEMITSPAFRTPELIDDRREIDRLLNDSRTVLTLVIPSGFQRDLYRGGASLQVLVDGTQSTAAYLSSAYLGSVIERYAEGVSMQRLEMIRGLPRVGLEPRIFFNPLARDDLFEGINEFFMVVSLIGMILPAAILIREKEYGTIEQILISPLSIRRLLLMKMVASSIFLLAMIAFSYQFVLKLWLGFPLKGTIHEFLLISLVYGTATSGLAFIIASVARRFSQIGMLTIAIFAPMLLLSGGWVPPEALPEWLRRLTVVSPMKYYMDLGIGLLIRGAGIGLLLPKMLRLLMLGSILTALGYLLYRRRVLRME